MANRRMIYQDLFEDDYIGMRDRDMRLMWIGLIAAVADDQGRLLDNASLIRAKVFVYDNDISTALIEDWLVELADAGKILRYMDGNKPVIQIVNWWEYQIPSWAGKSKYAPPQDWTDRVKVHAVGNKVEMLNWDKVGGLCTSLRTGAHKPKSESEGEVKDESEGEYEGEGEAPTATSTKPDAFVVYEQEIGLLTPSIADRLKLDIDDFSEPWVIDAIKIASGANARNMKYIEAILSRWKTTGKDDGTKPKREYQGKPTPESIDEQNERVIKEVIAESMKGKFDAKGNRI